ncbi:hypothetical protein [Bdellovibrio sp. HCB337]|uniref:hypothetical protein n=1 Tax=Bdellovibrio sp. HCB337 TaxID=3394358 RepID=UPI0039A6A8EF
MKRNSTIFYTLIFVLLCSSESWARERRYFYEGVRGRGMGGAQIATVNDETALLINPAGLGKLREFYGTIFDPELEYSNNLNSMNQSSSITEPFSIGGIKNTLDASRDTYYHAKAQIFPSMVSKNFGIGIYSSYLLDGEMNTAGTNMDVYYRSDLALALGYNFRFFDGRIKLGFGAKIINRIEVDNPLIDPTGALDLVSVGATEGTGLATDVGLIMTAPWAMLPTLSIVAHDVGNTAFDKASGLRLTTTDRPATVPQDVDVALAIFPIHSNKVRSTWTVEYRGLLTAKDETDKAKLIHGGAEVNIADIFFIRAGYNQRYYTAGLEFASERTQFQIATYGEEIGDETTPREDRRTVFKFAFRF